MKRVMGRWGLVALIGASGAYCAVAQPWASAEPGLQFQTVAVGKGTLTAQVTAGGTLSARRTVLVGAQISGRVVELLADFNDEVRKGQPIARLDDELPRAQLAELVAEHQRAVAQRARAAIAALDAERQLARQRALAAQQLIALASVEQAELELELAQATLEAATAQVRQAAAAEGQGRTTLGYTIIYAPVDGVVLSRAVDVGQTVAASLQAPTLFSIAEDLALLQIDTAVAEADVGRLAAGMKAQFTVDAFPGKRFEGVVRQVRNAAVTVAGVVTYDAVIDVGNADGALRPGMTTNVTFIVEEIADAVTIPNAALRFRVAEEHLEVLADTYGELGQRGGKAREPAAATRGGGGRGDRGDRGERGRRGGRSGRNERQPVWKLENGKPKMVLIRPGFTDGTATHMAEGELRPTELLITEIRGLPVINPRKVSAF